MMNDLISRQAAITAIQKKYADTEGGEDKYAVWKNIGLTAAMHIMQDLPSVQPEQQWIPVKMRPMDTEEREYWGEQFGYEIENKDAVMFDCPMPEDGQEILVSYRKWINMDRCEIDGGCYGLEGNGDWEDVIAWMPLPEPYRGDEP